jgi:HK97 family phage prohead protease
METLFKTFKGEVTKEEDGSLNIFIPLSTSTMDRDGEVIEPSAFKKSLSKFMEHPVLVASHDYKDLKNQIGEWTKLKVTDKGLEGKPKYYRDAGNDTADWAYYLASKGVAAFSVGFIPKTWDDGDGVKTPRKTFKEVELLEISHCIIPSNRDAVMTMRSKSVDPIIQKTCDEALKEIPVKTSQEQIIDEIDYLKSLIDKEGLSEQAKVTFKDLIKRLPIDVIQVTTEPVKIEPTVNKNLTVETETINRIISETIKNVIKEL